MGRVFVGTSGWSYKSWAATFYPPKLPSSKHLAFYIEHFPTVEINATFYRLPSENMARGWHDKSPEGFQFAVKGSRFITHMKKLKDVEQGLERFWERIDPLAERTGPILWQLPPMLQKDLPRLDYFLKLLPARYSHAVEFRHQSWLETDTFKLLRKHNVPYVWLSSLAMPPRRDITGSFIYLRFHGLEGGFAHDYKRSELRPWADALLEAAEDGRDSYVYFNNDGNTRAPQNAKTLIEMLGAVAVPPVREMAFA
jgi:uncharacterized protein YecE (DUF72 family)